MFTSDLENNKISAPKSTADNITVQSLKTACNVLVISLAFELLAT
jgi:hypothetical protein